jgi:hypothetical protein
MFLAILMLAVVWALFRWCLHTKAASHSKASELYKAFQARWTKWNDSVIAVAKQLLGFFQVVVLLRSVYRIPFPTLYIDVLGRFAFVDIDFIFIFRTECFMETNWHTRVYIMGVVCVCCMIGTVMTIKPCGLPSQRTRNVEFIVWSLKRVGNALLMLGYFVYASATTIFFQTFNCQQIDSSRYLRNDLSVDCSDAAHETATAFATLMVLGFSVGLPL